MKNLVPGLQNIFSTFNTRSNQRAGSTWSNLISFNRIPNTTVVQHRLFAGLGVAVHIKPLAIVSAKHFESNSLRELEGWLTFFITSLRKMISVSFIVKSSSLVPDFKSLTTEGLIHSGGTRSLVRIKSEGLPASGFIRSRGISSAGILLKRFNTTNGFKFSYKNQTENGKIKPSCNNLQLPSSTLLLNNQYLKRINRKPLSTHKKNTINN